MTKDGDYLDQLFLSGTPPPWIVQLRCGNLRASALRTLLERCWPDMLALLLESRAVLLYADQMEALT
ncbi:DUF5615 family PIN-like protein [Deinococcus detaillensis]|nr:DUF5615 family PIN-like protein [Deinococcus detaillensis]